LSTTKRGSAWPILRIGQSNEKMRVDAVNSVLAMVSVWP